MRKRILVALGAWVGIALLLTACAPRLTLRPTAPLSAAQKAELSEASEVFYASTSGEGLRQAAARALSAAPQSAVAQDLAAQLALLEDRRFAAYEATFEALRALDDDPSALWLLQRLAAFSMTDSERLRTAALYRHLSQFHPNAELRQQAAFELADTPAFWSADADAYRQAAKAIALKLPLAVIGPFDNDQGKGFGIEYPPEKEIDFKASYPGKIVPVSWRLDMPKNNVGATLLHDGLYPDEDMLAYAVTAFETKEAGEFELRLSTSSAAAVWVDETQVFASRELERFLFDGVVIPLSLPAGKHRVLIKSAHESGEWKLLARLCLPGGAPPSPGQAWPIAADSPPSAPLKGVASVMTEKELIAWRVKDFADEPGKKAYLAARFAAFLGARQPFVDRTELGLKAAPRSFIFRNQLVVALWNNRENGRAFDVLGELRKEAPPEFLALSLRQADFWRAQKLNEKARDVYRATIAQFPDRPSAYFSLADYLGENNWIEEQLALLTEMSKRFPGWIDITLDLAQTEAKFGYVARSRARMLQEKRKTPIHFTILQRLFSDAIDYGDFARAVGLARELSSYFPGSSASWRMLGDAWRLYGDETQARAAYETYRRIMPTAPDPYYKLGSLAFRSGDKARAISYWQDSLRHNPDDDSLADLLAYEQPEKKDPWKDDVPSEEQIEEALMRGTKMIPPAGADQIYLLDHSVCALMPDGSASTVTTLVARAVNKSGADHLIMTRIPSHQRYKILSAYAITADGQRQEPSSVRGGEIRFQKLGPGSSTVLQYRLEEPPNVYLNGSYYNSWIFQSPQVFNQNSRFVLWAPVGTPLNLFSRGDIAKSQETRGAYERYEWARENNTPYIGEPQSPPFRDSVAVLALSTLPSWEAFFKWEVAILKNAFQTNDEIEALAKKLFDGAPTAMEKLLRLQVFMQEEIRYQMDYEEPIAGVKPHAAPLVLARRYGDCKDKAVLFITLAKLAGIEAHFALLRTRDQGEIDKDVPSQQFNHVIVYVPAQEGFAEGRFFDPTADALDAHVLRPDDAGAMSLVLDMKNERYYWQQIPFQAPGAHRIITSHTLTLGADGLITGRMNLQSEGFMASTLRIVSRNGEQIEQMLQNLLANQWPGSTQNEHRLLDVKDLRKAAQVEVDFTDPGALRREGREGRLRLPGFLDFDPKGYFKLFTRRWPLVWGNPRQGEVFVRLALPPKVRVKRLPEPVNLKNECLSYTREAAGDAQGVTLRQNYTLTCERISAQQYATMRVWAEELMNRLQDDLVLEMPPVAAPKKGN